MVQYSEYVLSQHTNKKYEGGFLRKSKNFGDPPPYFSITGNDECLPQLPEKKLHHKNKNTKKFASLSRDRKQKQNDDGVHVKK